MWIYFVILHTEKISLILVLVLFHEKHFPLGRLRVNMGNIYCEQKKYPQAVKQYRMALDQVPNTHKDMRYVKGTRSENNIL